MGDVNYLAVLISSLISFALGAVWYNPSVFGKKWQEELGYTDEYLQEGNMSTIFGTTFILILIMIFGLAHLFQTSDMLGVHSYDWLTGLKHGALVGLFFVSASYGINLLYQRRSLTLWLIDSGYQILFLALSGAILATWQ